MTAVAPLPIVSVIIPAYNGAALIGETLDTLTRQTLTAWEALVIDDRSTDATREVVRQWPDPRVRLIENAVNSGVVVTRNRGVAEARGRYIAALDHDDLCLPERFARQVAYLDAHPEIALVGTQAEQITDGVVSAMGYAPHTTPDLIAWLSWIENPLVWSTVMMRTVAAQRLDPFSRREMLYAEDLDLYHRIAAFGGIARLDQSLLLYRQHAGGASKRFTEAMRAAATRVLAERHAALLGNEAESIARLLVLYNMGRLPVPDRATLHQLGDGIVRLQAGFIAAHRPDRENRKLIRWETARRWGTIGRVALRSGSVGIRDIIAVRPPHLGLGYAGVETLAWAGAIGAVRRLRARDAA